MTSLCTWSNAARKAEVQGYDAMLTINTPAEADPADPTRDAA